MQIEIKNTDGKWTLNGKPYAEMNLIEREFFHRFLNEVRIENGIGFNEPRTVKETIQVVQRLVNRIDINDAIFDKPLSEIETNFEIVTP